MSVEDLIKQATLYCEATLRSDMAKRIMYSIIPGLADKTQIYHTQGVVDYKALQAAAEGRRDMIKYGTLACLGECEHYRPTPEPGSDIPGIMQAKEIQSKKVSHFIDQAKKGKYEDAIDFALQCFADYRGWAKSFGGKAWENIAKTVKKLITYDNELLELKTTPKPSKENQQEITQVLQQIIMEMNVFDGLSHNTAEVMNNLIEEELKAQNPNLSMVADEWPKKYQDEQRKMKKLMDAKEINNIFDVYKQVKQDLVDSGEINRFKDWTSKLESSPEFYKRNPKLERELALIRVKKLMIGYKHDLNIGRDILKNFIEKVSSEIFIKDTNPMSFFHLVRNKIHIEDASLNNTITNIRFFFRNHLRAYGIDKHLEKEIEFVSDLTDQIKAKTRMLIDSSNYTSEALSDHSSVMAERQRINTKVVRELGELFNLVSRLVFFLDSL